MKGEYDMSKIKKPYTIVVWCRSQEFLDLELSGNKDFLENAEPISPEECEQLGCGSIAYRITTDWLEKYYSNEAGKAIDPKA